MGEPIETLRQTHDTVMRLAFEFGPRLLTVALIMVAGLFIMNWVAKIVTKGLERLALEAPVRELLVRIARTLVLLLFLVIALQNLGIEPLPLIAGEEGGARAVSLFTTTLRHTDLSAVVIPNSKIAGEILHNYGAIRQLNLRVGVAYATDIDDAVAAISKVLAANTRVLKEPRRHSSIATISQSDGRRRPGSHTALPASLSSMSHCDPETPGVA
jgi:small conductance mechanosensitive channel